MKRRWAAWVLLSVAACRPEPTVAPEPIVEPPGPEPLVSAKGRGESVDEAYSAAEQALASALLGDARWAELAQLDVHERDKDLLRVARDGGDTTVMAGLVRDRAALALLAFDEATPHFECPAPWRDTLYQYLFAHLRAVACERRMALLQAECEVDDTSDIDTAFAQLTAGLRLVEGFAGGVPKTDDGLVREATVLAFWHGVPLADLPLRVNPTGSEPQAVRTDGAGRVVLGNQGDPWTVSLDAEALLGPMSRSWTEPPQVEITTRPLTRSRRVFVVDAPMPIPSLSDGPTLSSAAQSRVLDTSGQARASAVQSIANAQAGRVDVVVVVEGTASYAGRAGSGRRWFEAKLDGVAYDAWSGAELERFAVTETALGDADAQARDAAVHKAARSLLDAYEVSTNLPPRASGT